MTKMRPTGWWRLAALVWPCLSLGCLLLGCSFLGCRGQRDASRDQSPNILLIVVDTLRFDHLTFYGYPRDTSPQMQRLLADRGVVVDSAYAQAPWTLPSVASLFTGVAPEKLLDDQGLPWGVPETATTVAEALGSRGYRTAAFIANPTLHRSNGFAQGFDEFWTAPYELASMQRHADDITNRVLPWLEDSDDTPFFLYVHYLDPHDPYDNSDLIDGRSPFMPEYSGRLRGGDVHGLYLGALQLDDPEQDVAHLIALYDSEIAFVDRHVGRLLDSVEPDRLANTLVILTSDHGEELFDHGGWKHGETLYEEMIHVPLVVRWDGRLPAAQRAAGTVRLLDLWPTIMAAAGPGSPVDAREGVNLLPMLTGQAMPEAAAFSSHLAGGPLRVARVAGHTKEILFDRHAPFLPADERDASLWRRDVQRLQRRESYSLLDDAAEQQNLAASAVLGSLPSSDLDELWQVIDSQIGPGVRLVARLPTGAKLEGHVTFGAAPTTVRSLLAAAEDQHHVEGNRIELSWIGDDIPKGLWLGGALRHIEELELTLDGEPLTLTTRLSGGASAGTWPQPLRALRLNAAPEWPANQPTVHLWVRGDDRPFGSGQRDEETLRRLKALGYTD